MLPGEGGGSVFTPPTGSPGQIRSGAAQLTSIAGRAGDLVRGVGRAAGASVADATWVGSAATGFHGRAGDVSTATKALEAPAQTLARACTAYADALDTAQRAILAAKQRYDAAEAEAQAVADRTNADPDRTPADVAAADAHIARLGRTQQDAVDDATRAWSTFRAEERAAVGQASDAAGDLTDDPTLRELRELLKSVDDTTEPFSSLWELAWAVPAIRNLAAASRGLPLPSQTIDTLLKDLSEVAPDLARADYQAAQALTRAAEELNALRALQAEGPLSAANAARLAELEQALPGLQEAAAAASSATRTAALGELGFGALSKGLGVLSVIGDVSTLFEPLDEGAWGTVDRVAAGANLAGMGVGAAAELGLIAATGPIPVVGEVVVIGTGLYLAGDWLYHNWQPFHDVCDQAWSTGQHLVQAQTALLVDGAQTTYHVAGDLLSGGTHALGDAASGAWQTAGALAQGDWGGAASAAGDAFGSVAGDIGSTVSDVGHDLADGASGAWNALTSIF